MLATEKKLPVLMDATSVEKISLITDNIGIVYSGLGPDTRVLVRKGRKRAQKYFRVYHEPIPVNQLVRELASIMQEFTQSGYVTALVCPHIDRLWAVCMRAWAWLLFVPVCFVCGQVLRVLHKFIYWWKWTAFTEECDPLECRCLLLAMMHTVLNCIK